MAQGQPGERGARGTEVKVRGRVVCGVRESPLRHALVRGGSADRRVGAHDWRKEDGPEEDGPDKGEGPPATHAGFVARGPPKPSWTIITKVTRPRWPRFGGRVQDDASVAARTRSELSGSAPEHRPEADRLEVANPEQLRIEGVRDDRHHRGQRVDDEDVLREERGREQEQSQCERGVRARIDAAVHDEEGGGESDVDEADQDAGRHHLAHGAHSDTAVKPMDVSPVIDRLLPTAAIRVEPPRRSRNWPRGTRSGSTAPHIPSPRAASRVRSVRGGRDDVAPSGSRGRGSPTAGSRCTVGRAASRGSSPGSGRPACPRSGTRAAAAAPRSRWIARRTVGPAKEGVVAQLTTGQLTTVSVIWIVYPEATASARDRIVLATYPLGARTLNTRQKSLYPGWPGIVSMMFR